MLLPFILVTSLFFFWGFVHNLDPILIPHLRKAFRLNNLQSSLVDSAVFIAYFIMALPAGFIMRKYGYKSGILIGLILFAIGSFFIHPRSQYTRIHFFLGALFVIACGLTFLETAANPYATVLGPASSATQRLNLAQSFNGLAAVLAPLIGGRMIFSGTDYTDAQLAAMTTQARNAYLQSEADTVKMPYLILGLVILLVTALIFFHEDARQQRRRNEGWKRQSIACFTPPSSELGRGCSVLLCRCAGLREQLSSSSSPPKPPISKKQQQPIILGLGYGIAFMGGRFAGTFLMKYISPARLLTIYALVNVLLSLIAIFAEGMITVYALIGIAFFMSIMFPTIFSLGIKDLGKDTKLGSSLIVMSIVGGALLPPVLGYIADITHNIQYGYSIPLICFIVVAYFGWKGHKVQTA